MRFKCTLPKMFVFHCDTWITHAPTPVQTNLFTCLSCSTLPRNQHTLIDSLLFHRTVSCIWNGIARKNKETASSYFTLKKNHIVCIKSCKSIRVGQFPYYKILTWHQGSGPILGVISFVFSTSKFQWHVRILMSKLTYHLT